MLAKDKTASLQDACIHQGLISSSPCGIWCIFPSSLIIPSETQYW
jgi:hypothetical protein